MLGIMIYSIYAPVFTIPKALIYGHLEQIEKRAAQARIRILGIGNCIIFVSTESKWDLIYIFNSTSVN